MLPPVLALFFVLLPIQPIYSLAINSSSVSYAPGTSDLSAATNSTAADSCDDIHTCRTLYSIVQTCLATIFACVWVAVHRNISGPKPRDTRSSNVVIRATQWLLAKILDQRQSIVVFVVTLIAPEWVLAWAIRQAIRARKLAKELEEARTHATKIWTRDGTEHPKEQQTADIAEMAEDEENRTTSVSLRSGSDDELPLIERRAPSRAMSTSPHVKNPENQIECAFRVAGILYLFLIQATIRDPCGERR